MRFVSRYRKATYVVVPARVRIEGGFRETSTPVRAYFTNHLFDSEIAQRTYGWTDETREQVETHLQRHVDFGVTLHLDRSATPTPVAAAEGKAPATERCILFTPTDEGVDQCGNAAIPGEPYCSLHKAEVAKLAEAQKAAV